MTYKGTDLCRTEQQLADNGGAGLMKAQSSQQPLTLSFTLFCLKQSRRVHSFMGARPQLGTQLYDRFTPAVTNTGY